MSVYISYEKARFEVVEAAKALRLAEMHLATAKSKLHLAVEVLIKKEKEKIENDD